LFNDSARVSKTGAGLSAMERGMVAKIHKRPAFGVPPRRREATRFRRIAVKTLKLKRRRRACARGEDYADNRVDACLPAQSGDIVRPGLPVPSMVISQLWALPIRGRGFLSGAGSAGNGRTRRRRKEGATETQRCRSRWGEATSPPDSGKEQLIIRDWCPTWPSGFERRRDQACGGGKQMALGVLMRR